MKEKVYQILWSEVKPTKEIAAKVTLTRGGKLDEIAESKVQVGVDKNGRRLYHALVLESEVEKFKATINKGGKGLKLIRASDKEDVEYGYEKKLKKKAQITEESMYELKRKESKIILDKGVEKVVPVTPLVKEEDPTPYLEEYQEEVEGKMVTITPSDHRFAGWAEMEV